MEVNLGDAVRRGFEHPDAREKLCDLLEVSAGGDAEAFTQAVAELIEPVLENDLWAVIEMLGASLLLNLVLNAGIAHLQGTDDVYALNHYARPSVPAPSMRLLPPPD